MNYQLLRERAVALGDMTRCYAEIDPEIAVFYRAMRAYLSEAEAGLLSEETGPGVLPCQFFVLEGHLKKYPELDQAYADLYIETIGGEPPALKALRERMAARDKPL